MTIGRSYLRFCFVIVMTVFLTLSLGQEVGYAETKEPAENKGFFEGVVDEIKDIWNKGLVDYTKTKVQKTGQQVGKTVATEVEDAARKLMNEILPDQANYEKCKMDPTCYFATWAKIKLVNTFKQTCEYFVDIIIISEEKLYGKGTKGIFIHYQKIVQDLAWTFLILFLTFQSIRVLAYYTVEVDSTHLKLLIKRLVITSILIALEPEIIKMLLRLNKLLIDAFLEPHQSVIGATILIGLLKPSSPVYLPVINELHFVLCVVILIFLVIIMLQFIIRYAEIALLMILGPFAIATNINQEYNIFPVWWRHLLAAIFTQVVQVMLVVIWLSVLKSSLSLDIYAPYRLLLSIGFLVVAFRAPGFLREWMYSTGATSSVMSGVRTGVHTAKTVTRTALSFVKP